MILSKGLGLWISKEEVLSIKSITLSIEAQAGNLRSDLVFVSDPLDLDAVPFRRSCGVGAVHTLRHDAERKRAVQEETLQ